MDQNHHFWICLISALTLNFERLFRGCLFLMKDYLWLKFQQTQAIFEGERAQKSPKSSHFMDAASPRKHLKLYNLTTTNATLMNLTVRSGKPKTSQNEPENRFWAQFQVFLRIK